MGSDLYYLNLQDLGENPVDHPPLKSEPGGAMALPLTR